MNKKKDQNITAHYDTVSSYIIGFLLSILLTLSAYILVTNHMLKPGDLVVSIVVLAMIQLIVQLIFFLHLGKTRLNLIFFLSTVVIILIVVVASLWIMHHLNYNMHPSQMDKVIVKDEGIYK